MNPGNPMLLLALTSDQMMTMLVACGSVVAIVIVFIVFKVMSRPVPGYNPESQPDSKYEAPAEDPVEEEIPEEINPVRSQPFVLPLPSQAAPLSTPVRTAESPPRPVSAAPTAPAKPASAPQEPTVGIGRGEAVRKEPDVLAEGGTKTAPQPEVFQHLFVFRSGTRDGEAVRLDSFAAGECSIGRSDVPDNQIVIRDDLKVSRVQHAIVTRDSSGRYFIRDNNSANKVYVNEQCIENTPIALNHRDKIRIGLTELEYLKEPVS